MFFFNVSDMSTAGTVAIANRVGQAVFATMEGSRRETARLVSLWVCKDWYHYRATYVRREAVRAMLVIRALQSLTSNDA